MYFKCCLVTEYVALTSWCGTGAYEYAGENTMQMHNVNHPIHK